MRLQVFYALMFVVVEGYNELGGHYPEVDRLLEQSEFVNAFRGFRNAVFHLQEEPVSPKLTAFLAAEGSEQWTHELYRALKAFFEAQTPIKEFITFSRSAKRRSGRSLCLTPSRTIHGLV
jgi:hypothetical protein